VNSGSKIGVASATGSLGGGGLDPETLGKSIALGAEFVGADGGTVDAGPYHLGSGTCAYSRDSMLQEVDQLLATVPQGIPIVVGSAGTAGGDPHVDWMMDIVGEVVARRGLQRKVAAIKTEQRPDYLKEMMRKGRVRPLENAPHFDEGTIDRSTRIVGMMGVEPLQHALAEGADIVIAGRCSDSAIFASYPVMRGMPEGIAWHVGKVVECGTLACETMKRGTMLAHLDAAGATITPLGDGLRCTPQSIAAHSLYENSDPYLHPESSGTLDLTHSTFEQVGDVSVRIEGSSFRPADQYSVKLEGAELVGYQSVIVGGVRDPLIIRQLDRWLDDVKRRLEARAVQVLGHALRRDEWRIDIHVYGRNAVMASREPRRDELPSEVGLVVCLMAPTQELASKLADLARQPLLHMPIPEWSGAITGFACLFNQASIDRGPVWKWCTHHVVLPERPMDMFRTEIRAFG
jgi:hypothetical protein